MNLDKEELEETRKHNGSNDVICISRKLLEEKYEEQVHYGTMKRNLPNDLEQYNFILGRASILKALLEGDIDKI